MKIFSQENILNFLRIAMSFILLWAFSDKLLGLGFATLPENAWLAGASPTSGFLKFGVSGLFSPLFQGLSGNILVDILYMGGLLLVGLCLLLGIGMKIASYSGALMMALIYLSLFPSENNPLIDEHIIYILVFLLLSQKSSSFRYSLGNKWRKISFIKKHPLLS